MRARTFRKKVGIVVDGFSTGKHIAPALEARGYDCIHILSNPNHPKRQQIDPKQYIETIIYSNNFDEIVKKLKGREVLFCVPGDESGVIVSDYINEALNLSNSNGSEFTLAKRDKYRMNEVAEKAGLPVVRHYRASKLEGLIAWIKTIGAWPIVLKPLDSASGDGVFICNNIDEVTEKFQTILGSKNKFGYQNIEILAEEYNPGTEYIVSTVSCNGKHHIVEIWKMNKIEGTIIHDSCEYLDRDADHEVFSKIEKYCHKLLNAFAIKFGAGTIELKYVEGKSPVLIEIGARLTGDAELSLTYEMLGYNQLSLMLDAYINPAIFNAIAEHSLMREKAVCALAVLLISPVEGTVIRELTPIFQFLMTMAALHSFELPIEGDEIRVTRNISTCPGTVYLRHNDKNEIQRAYAGIRDIEKQGLYSNFVGINKNPNPLGLLFSEANSKLALTEQKNTDDNLHHSQTNNLRFSY